VGHRHPGRELGSQERSEARRGADDCRCRCGSLVARIVHGGVEIRCRRCKRDLLVPWSARGGWIPPLELAAPGLRRAGGGE
jgi:hypothetical protein